MKGTPVGAGASRQHTRTAPGRALAGLLVPASLTAAAGLLGWAASTPISAVRAPGPAPVDALLALGAALLCAALLAVAAVGATLSLAVCLTGQVTGRLVSLALVLTPRAVQAAVGVALGVTVIAGPALGASASSVATLSAAAASAPAPGPSDQRHRAAQLPPGWSPDRPEATDSAAPASTTRTLTTPTRTPAATSRTGAYTTDRSGRGTAVVVHRGDTLWAIAAHHLGSGATNAAIAAEWPRWHAANRSTIGADPHLILPGQRLHPPEHRPTREASNSEESQ